MALFLEGFAAAGSSRAAPVVRMYAKNDMRGVRFRQPDKSAIRRGLSILLFPANLAGRGISHDNGEEAHLPDAAKVPGPVYTTAGLNFFVPLGVYN
jgi:hypothetical protein